MFRPVDPANSTLKRNKKEDDPEPTKKAEELSRKRALKLLAEMVEAAKALVRSDKQEKEEQKQDDDIEARTLVKKEEECEDEF
jgi:hypothetical protein